jgi:hypothetical protein
MSRRTRITHEFVEFIPKELEEGVLYVSIPYSTAVHKCACGCGNKITTPISPTRWRLTYDGETVSLWPSVGNWSYPCQSHYWIERNRIEWAPTWSRAKIEASRTRDREERQRYYERTTVTERPEPAEEGLAARLLKRVGSFFRN